MQQGSAIKVTVLDAAGSATLWQGVLPHAQVMVEGVLAEACKTATLDPTKFCLAAGPNKSGLMPRVPLMAYFGHVGPGGNIQVLLCQLQPGIIFLPPPPHAPGAAGAPAVPSGGQGEGNKDLATMVATKIYDASKMKPEDLVPLLSNCSEATLRELAQLQILKGKRKKGEKKVGDLKFAKFYQDIVKDMEQQLLDYQENAVCEVSVFVQCDLTLSQFLGSRALNIDMVCEYVRNADEAVSGARRLSIINYITLGNRLEEAFAYWEKNKKSAEMKQRNISIWPQFLRFIGERYTSDYGKQLRTLGVIAKQYPNVKLISSCGIGELAKNACKLLDFLDAFPDEAIRWRVDAAKEMGWTRRTNITMGEEHINKMQCLTMEEVEEDESYEEWNGRREGAVRSYIEELKAEAEAAAEAKQEQSTATQNAKDKISSINKE